MMAGLDKMVNLVNTMLDDKEFIILLGPGASMDGRQGENSFPGFDDLIDTVLADWKLTHSQEKSRLENFLSVIKKWEMESVLASRLSKYLDGEPGPAHYRLAALTVALYAERCNLTYLTTAFDDLMQQAFVDLKRNQVRKYRFVPLSLRPDITGSKFRELVNNMESHIKEGQPVILKLFGDLDSQSPIFPKDDMIFEPAVEEKLKDWMKKPMIVIGYHFADQIVGQILIASRGVSPVFFVTPDPGRIPDFFKNLDRVYILEIGFTDFMNQLTVTIEEKKPTIIKNMDIILQSVKMPPIVSAPLQIDTGNRGKDDPCDNGNAKEKKVIEFRQRQIHVEPVKRILILAANSMGTSGVRFDKDIQVIKEGILVSRNRYQFELKSRLVVRYKDLRRELLDFRPHVVHFIGHGDSDGIKIEDESGKVESVSAESLVDLFELCADYVRCVILSSCFTRPQVDAIAEHIAYVIGMRDKIPNGAAIAFFVAFYDALLTGLAVEKAFQLGLIDVRCKYPDFSIHFAPVLRKK